MDSKRKMRKQVARGRVLSPTRTKARFISTSKLSDKSSSARDRALHVLADMRHDPNLSITRAAKMRNIKRETIKKYFSSSLNKVKGKFQVTKSTATQQRSTCPMLKAILLLLRPDH
jgi:hypothetical protein